MVIYGAQGWWRAGVGGWTTVVRWFGQEREGERERKQERKWGEKEGVLLIYRNSFLERYSRHLMSIMITMPQSQESWWLVIMTGASKSSCINASHHDRGPKVLIHLIQAIMIWTPKSKQSFKPLIWLPQQASAHDLAKFVDPWSDLQSDHKIPHLKA